MPKKTKAKKMPTDFYNMQAFNEKDKKISMKEVFGKNAPKAKTNIKQTKGSQRQSKTEFKNKSSKKKY